jgi:hypothetical protein
MPSISLVAGPVFFFDEVAPFQIVPSGGLRDVGVAAPELLSGPKRANGGSKRPSQP